MSTGEVRMTTPRIAAGSLLENEKRRRLSMGKNFATEACIRVSPLPVVGETPGAYGFATAGGCMGEGAGWAGVSSMATRSSWVAERTTTFFQTPPEEYERRPTRPDGTQSFSTIVMCVTFCCDGKVAVATIWHWWASSF